MQSTRILFGKLNKISPVIRCMSQYGKGSGVSSTSSSSPPKCPAAPTTKLPTSAAGVNANVPGLSSKCVLPKTGPLGPGAKLDGEYKVPEYYCYDKTSYAEAEIEMANYRCAQPNANRKE